VDTSYFCYILVGGTDIQHCSSKIAGPSRFDMAPVLWISINPRPPPPNNCSVAVNVAICARMYAAVYNKVTCNYNHIRTAIKKLHIFKTRTPHSAFYLAMNNVDKRLNRLLAPILNVYINSVDECLPKG
jgi:hypothetical protein